jgi:hypothetical protein
MDQIKLLAQVSHSYPSLEGQGISPGTDQGVSALDKVVSNAIGILTIVAVIFFAIQIILAGYSFLSAQGDEKKLEIARTRLTSGILGLVIVVVALGATALIAKLLGIDDVFNLSTVISGLLFN